jgi:hypothetical protein
MYDPKEPVAKYFARIVRTVEGLLVIALSCVYVTAFVFFEDISTLATSYNYHLTTKHRVAFVLMPMLLLVALLWMDSTARTPFERMLTVFVVIVCALIPILNILS